MKKGLAIFLVLSLIASMMMPFSVSATWPPTGYLTGEGHPATFQTHADVLGGVVPTSVILNFAIDPQGLLGLTVGDTIADAVPSNLIVFGNPEVEDDDVVAAWNTSNVPVVFNVELSFGTAGSTAVFTEADVTEGDTANVLMWVEPSAEVATEGDTFVGIGLVSPFGTAGDTTGGDVRFLLEEVAYQYVVAGAVDAQGVVPTNRVRVADTPNSHGTALRFSGIINLEACWEDVGRMTVSALFSMVEACETAVAAAATPSATVPYGWLNTFTTGGDTYVPPTLITIPEGAEGLSTDERDAVAAARAAGTATTNANRARGLLDGAIAAFGASDETAGDVAVLEEAIEAAETALDTARGALGIATAARTAAINELVADNASLVAIVNAVTALSGAVDALEGRIADAGGLIGPSVGFLVGDSVVQEISATRTGSWVLVAPVQFGDSTIVSAQFNDLTPITWNRPAAPGTAAAPTWANLNDAGFHLNSSAGTITLVLSCTTVLTVDFR